MPKRKLENQKIEVILLHADKHLGEKYEIVRVKPIFARNILLPQNIAVLADSMNKNAFAQKIKAADEARAKKVSGLEELFMKIQNDEGVVITRKTNKDKTLYAKVDENDIAKAIAAVYGIEIDSHLFKLKKKIAALGQFVVPFLYKGMKKDVLVVVKEDTAKEEVKEEKKEEVAA